MEVDSDQVTLKTMTPPPPPKENHEDYFYGLQPPWLAQWRPLEKALIGALFRIKHNKI